MLCPGTKLSLPRPRNSPAPHPRLHWVVRSTPFSRASTGSGLQLPTLPGLPSLCCLTPLPLSSWCPLLFLCKLLALESSSYIYFCRTQTEAEEIQMPNDTILVGLKKPDSPF